MFEFLRSAVSGRSAAVLFLGLFLSAFVGGASAAPLKTAYVEFPPFTYTDTDGSPKGNLIDLLAKVSADAGLTYTAESAPARRLFQGVADGSYDLFLGIKTPEVFQGTTVIGQSVIARIDLHAYGIGQVPVIKAREDLSGKKVIVLTGYSYGGWRAYMDDPANKVEVIEARTPEQALQLLTAGRAPVLLQYSLPMAQATDGRTVTDLKSTLISSLDCYFAVSAKRPDAAETVAKLDGSFYKLKAAGALP
jgi:polar amino acid transport system substrate-binding protein